MTYDWEAKARNKFGHLLGLRNGKYRIAGIAVEKIDASEGAMMFDEWPSDIDVLGDILGDAEAEHEKELDSLRLLFNP